MASLVEVSPRFGGAGGDGGERNGAVLFAMSIVFLGVAFVGLYLAFHSPDNLDAETGGFPGLLGAMLKRVEGASQSSPYASGGGSRTSVPKGTAGLGQAVAACQKGVGGALGIGTGNQWLLNTVTGTVSQEKNWLNRQLKMASGAYIAFPTEADAAACRDAKPGEHL